MWLSDISVFQTFRMATAGRQNMHPHSWLYCYSLVLHIVLDCKYRRVFGNVFCLAEDTAQHPSSLESPATPRIMRRMSNLLFFIGWLLSNSATTAKAKWRWMRNYEGVGCRRSGRGLIRLSNIFTWMYLVRNITSNVPSGAGHPTCEGQCQLVRWIFQTGKVSKSDGKEESQLDAKITVYL